MHAPMHWRTAATALVSLWLCAAPPGQEPARPRLGVFFWHDSPNDLTALTGIRAGLARAGVDAIWIERHADSDHERATAMLAELRTAGCELVFALGTQATLLAKDALREVPVVFAAVSDAVASNVVPDWSGSGGNLCGASNWIGAPAVLDTFRLAVPGLRRLGVVRSRTSGIVSGAETATMRAHLAAEPDLGVTLVESVAHDGDDVERAVASLVARRVDAIWVPIDLTVYSDFDAVRRGVGGSRLPLLTTAAAGVGNGAHVGCVGDYELHGRRTAAIALRVLAGADPGRLPVDRMHGTQVKVDLTAARRDGIELPLSVLAVADELLVEAPR